MLKIQPFTSQDIPSALALSTQVGWNHLESDWQRCLSLNPAACLGGFIDTSMMATCTLTTFGKIGWVGTFLVDQSLRGKGQGKIMFEAMLCKAREQGVKHLGLDSSDAGRPIYLKYGFQMTGQGIELWTGPNKGKSHPEAQPLQKEDWTALLAFDQESVHVDRSAQLRLLAEGTGTSARVIRGKDGIQAFGFSRPGRMSGAIGPVVARDLQTATQIISSLMADRKSIDGEKPVGLALLDHPPIKNWLAEMGLQMRRRNIRMYHPSTVNVLSGPNVFATTGLGMG